MTAGGQPRKRDTRIAGSRGSRLALFQTNLVIELLRQRWPEVLWETEILSTHGDEVRDRPLPEIGGQGVFTEAIERALDRREIDFAVHSLKDLPTASAAGLALPAILDRSTAADVLISRAGLKLSELRSGSIVGTSSLRRQAQLLAARPDLEVRAIRGNVETRIAKVDSGEFDAVVLAEAGVARMGLAARVTEVLPPEVMLPAPGQGAIAVQCSEKNASMVTLLEAIDDPTVRACVTAERAFLAALGGGCSSPVSALAVTSEENEQVGALRVREAGGAEVSSAAHLPRGAHRPGGGDPAIIRLRGRISSTDGKEAIEVEGEDSDPERLGASLAQEALAKGAARFLERGRGAAARRAGGGLAGMRVVIARPEGRGEELSARLSSLGATVIAVPAITIVALSPSSEGKAVLARLADFDWVIFASESAVGPFADLVDCLPAARSALAGRRIAAVGIATARALKERGMRVDFIPTEQRAERLAAELPAPPGSRALLPRAESGRQVLPEGLKSRSISVTLLPIYRTEPRRFSPDERDELAKGFDAVLFSSGSTVSSFLDGCEAAFGASEARRALDAAKVICIGPSTSEVAERLGIRVDRIASDHSSEGLVESLREAFENAR